MNLKLILVSALQISIVATVFGFGLKATPADLLYFVHRPLLLLRSIVSVLIVMPLLAVLMARLFDLRPNVEIAMVALALSPLPPLLPHNVDKAHGTGSYALSLMASLGLLSIAFIPLVMNLLSIVFDRPLAVAPSAIAKTVLITVLLPLTAGMALRAISVTVANRVAKAAARIGMVLLVLGALVLLVSAAPAMWRLVGDGTMIAMLLFLLVGLGVGHALGGVNPDHNIVLALATACRHPAIALMIATANFPDEHFGARILWYLLLALIVCNLYLMWRRHAMQRQGLTPDANHR